MTQVTVMTAICNSAYTRAYVREKYENTVTCVTCVTFHGGLK